MGITETALNKKYVTLTIIGVLIIAGLISYI